MTATPSNDPSNAKPASTPSRSAPFTVSVSRRVRTLSRAPSGSLRDTATSSEPSTFWSTASGSTAAHAAPGTSARQSAHATRAPATHFFNVLVISSTVPLAGAG